MPPYLSFCINTKIVIYLLWTFKIIYHSIGQVLLSSTTSTEVYFNINHPALLALKTSDTQRASTIDKPKFVKAKQPPGQPTTTEIKAMTLIELIEAKPNANAKVNTLNIYYL